MKLESLIFRDKFDSLSEKRPAGAKQATNYNILWESQVYPNSHHGGWKKEYSKDYVQRTLAWMDKYLKKESVTTKPGEN